MVKVLEEKGDKLRIKKEEKAKQKAKEKAEQAERQLKEKLEKYVKKVDVGSLAAVKGLSALEAAHLHLKANAGDAESKRTIYEARCARKLEARIRQTASKGGLSIEEARLLHEQAHAGDQTSKEKIRQIRQTLREETNASDKHAQDEST